MCQRHSLAAAIELTTGEAELAVPAFAYRTALENAGEETGAPAVLAWVGLTPDALHV